MTAFPLESNALLANLTNLNEWLLLSGYPGVTVRFSGVELTLDGVVPDFQAKQVIESEAASMLGYPIRNLLRIMPS